MFAGMDNQTALFDVFARCQTVHQGLYRNHQNALAQTRETIQGLETLRGNVLVGGEYIVRQGFPVRKVQQRWPILAQVKSQLIV